MKLTSRCLLAVVLAIVSKGVWAADTYLNVFFGDSPLKGVEVTLNGELLGKTDKLGSASGQINEGEHTIDLLRGGERLTSFSFETLIDQDAEISITFGEQEVPPDIVIEKYGTNDTSVNGALGGTVTDIEDNPIQGVIVSVVDKSIETTTDSEGRYKLELPRGSYSFELDHPDYGTTSIEDIRILANVGRVAAVKLQPKADVAGAPQSPRFKVELAAPIEEVLVLGTFKSSDSSYELERFSSGVTDAIDISQIARFGDSTAAAALKRIVGVAVTDDKYANVRGLDGRYISSTLNGLMMPSTDPMRRDVQLDLFPAHILGGIEIQKSYSADLLGTTTGGSVKMHTRGIPDDRLFNASVSLGYNNDVTGEDIITYQSSSTDWAGFDGGRRGLSDLVLAQTGQGQRLNICSRDIDPSCVEPIEAAALALTFEDDYRVKSKKAIPDLGVSLAYGDRFDLPGGEVGFYAAAGYDYETSSRQEAVLDDPTDDTGNYDRSKISISANAYFAVGYEFNDADEILSKTILLRDTDDTTRFTRGVDEEDREFNTTILEWVERQFISQQVTGKNYFNVGGQEHVLNWRLGFSETERYEPDRRTYTYLNGNLANSAVERRWSELDEDSIDIGVDYTIPFDINDSTTTEFKIGGVFSKKDREVELYRFGIRSGANSDVVDFGNPNVEEVLAYQNFVLDGVRLAVRTTPTDSYNSEEDVTAYYLQNLTEFGDAWTLALGVRQEEFTQFLEYPFEELTTPDAIARREALETLESDESLPFVSLSYRPTETVQLRAGWSQTVSYPGIIERSESLSFDPATDDPIIGNPFLVSSTIENFDFRVEYYFSDEESISIAYFVKEIDDPIERAIPDASGSAAGGITFRNAESADVSGIEIDAYKNVLDLSDFLVFVSGNISIIDSEVTLDEDSLRLEGQTAQGRELQGQSPHLVNFQLGLDHYPTEQKFTFLINYFDHRIYRVSRGADQGPEFEVGRILIDLNYEKLFGESLKIKASIKNLLDEEVSWERNDRVIETYKDGVSFSFGASYEF